jgi:glutamyl-tRNA synthetase
MNETVVTRFAPSPTGLLHMGNYRTAVFAYLYAKKSGGTFILRIEDTDRARSKQEYEDNIIESLEWLGLTYDKRFRQSEHVESHTAHLKRLIEEGKAYVSKEEAKDGSGVMREVVRFKNPNKIVVFNDAIRGPIETDTTDLGDFVIAKSITEPLFHLAVVVDDHEEGVTHVIRGEDHIPNTPRQMLIAEALGFPHPTYAHLPLVLAEDRTKLSKRKGALPVTAYREMGYLPQALLNFMSFTGWNPGGEREIYTLSELIPLFDLEKIHKGGAIFNEEKLKWMNKEHMRLQSHEEQLSEVKKHMPDYPDAVLEKLLPTIIDRITTYGELASIADHEFGFFINAPTVPKEKILYKDDEAPVAIRHLTAIKEMLADLDLSSSESIKAGLMPYAETEGKGNVLWPLRMSLSGQERSVDPFTIIYVLGKEESVKRIESACHALSS